MAILVLLPAIVGEPGTDGGTNVGEIAWALGKAVAFIALILVVGVRLLPMLLTWIARTRLRELFLLAVVSLASGTAFAAYELFGVSFALGAFLAGVVMADTDIQSNSMNRREQTFMAVLNTLPDMWHAPLHASNSECIARYRLVSLVL